VGTDERFKELEKEVNLLRRGVWLAFQREKVPSYHMELQAVVDTADLVILLLRELKESLTEGRL
jgi:hypothetical protein